MMRNTLPPLASNDLLCRSLCKRNTKTQALRTTIFRGFMKPLDQLASVCLDYMTRCDIVRIGGQLNERKALACRLREQQLQGARCISALPLPRDHRVSDVA